MSNREGNTRAAMSERPDRPDRSFRPGQMVRFLPPESAYSRESVQTRHIGQFGHIYRQWNDGHAEVVFSGNPRPLVCNTAYLERHP